MLCITIAVFHNIIHYHQNIKIRCIVYLIVIHFADVVSEWYKILECYLLVYFVLIPYCCIWFCSNNFQSSLFKCVCITVVTNTWNHHRSLELNFTTCVLFFVRLIIHLNPVFWFEFWWFIVSILQQIYDIFDTPFSLYNHNYNIRK